MAVLQVHGGEECCGQSLMWGGGGFSCFDLCLGLRIVSIIVLNGAVVNQGLPYS